VQPYLTPTESSLSSQKNILNLGKHLPIKDFHAAGGADLNAVAEIVVIIGSVVKKYNGQQ